MPENLASLQRETQNQFATAFPERTKVYISAQVQYTYYVGVLSGVDLYYNSHTGVLLTLFPCVLVNPEILDSNWLMTVVHQEMHHTFQ